MKSKANDKERPVTTISGNPSAEQWLAKNRRALESSNAYIEAYGLPLADYQVLAIARFEHVAVDA